MKDEKRREKKSKTQKFGIKSEEKKNLGDILVNLHKNNAEILLDSTYDSLHKHGYRSSNVKGMIRETMAAAVIIESGVIQKA